MSGAFYTTGKLLVVFGSIITGSGLIASAVLEKTTEKPDHKRPKILVLGGSGLFCWGVSYMAAALLFPA